MGSATWSRPGRVWLVICVLAAAPRLYFAIAYPLGSDEYWHVFVARQDTREALALEWRLTVHPPLYYWLLKLALTLGSTRLVYRLVSLAAGIVAVLVIGRIVLQLTRDPLLSYLAALTFALAPPAVLASFEVRAYMLSICFILAAFSLYLSMLVAPSRTRIFCFSSLCCLALVSSYSAFFFVLACTVLTPPGTGTIGGTSWPSRPSPSRRTWRMRRGSGRSLPGNPGCGLGASAEATRGESTGPATRRSARRAPRRIRGRSKLDSARVARRYGRCRRSRGESSSRCSSVTASPGWGPSP